MIANNSDYFQTPQKQGNATESRAQMRFSRRFGNNIFKYKGKTYSLNLESPTTQKAIFLTGYS